MDEGKTEGYEQAPAYDKSTYLLTTEEFLFEGGLNPHQLVLHHRGLSDHPVDGVPQRVHLILLVHWHAQLEKMSKHTVQMNYTISTRKNN